MDGVSSVGRPAHAITFPASRQARQTDPAIPSVDGGRLAREASAALITPGLELSRASISSHRS